jgi:hypothetical protein
MTFTAAGNPLPDFQVGALKDQALKFPGAAIR